MNAPLPQIDPRHLAWRNTPQRYGTLALSLHWLMLGLIVAVYACMELRGFAPKGSALRAGMKTWHYMLGLSVLVLVVVRAVVHVIGPQPGIVPPPPRWQEVAAKAIHLALYALMVSLPLLGWLTLSAQGTGIPFFGLSLPALTAPDKATATWLKEIHETGATVGYFLIGLHAAAALFHHYVMRDNTLLRMLPRRSPPTVP